MQPPDPLLLPHPPYYAVIFTSRLRSADPAYGEMAERMAELAKEQDGYLGMESYRDVNDRGVTISYWRDEQAISRWMQVKEHQTAQQLGKSTWYSNYEVRVCKVERAYGMRENNKVEE